MSATRHTLLLTLALLASKGAHSLSFSDVGSGSAQDFADDLRIYGGSEADASQSPYVVNLRKEVADATAYCGGSLVASQFIVTAAHCVKTDVAVFASIGSRYSSGDSEGERIQVAESYVHPKYDSESKTHEYDVAMLKLAEPSGVTPIKLCSSDGSDNPVNTTATVLGWGLNESGLLQDTLQEVSLRIISNKQCDTDYEYDGRITSDMLCAGVGEGKDTCNGDSGGPLVANDVLVGIVSWGGKCGVAPGVYTRVSSVLEFIQGKIDGDSSSATSAPTPAPTTVVPASTTTAPTPATRTPAPTTTAPTAETNAPTPSATVPAPATTAPTPTTASTPTTIMSTPSPTTVSPTPSPTTSIPPSSTSKPSTASPSSTSASQSIASTNQASKSAETIPDPVLCFAA